MFEENVIPENDVEEVVWTIETARQALEEAREAENRAYHGMKQTVTTSRQKGILELAKLEEVENPDKDLLDDKCRLLLESYYLPRILKEGQTVKLNKEFTRFEDSEKDYIEAEFTSASGKNSTVGYNYKTEEDGKNLILFEKSFETVILKPGDPEKYVLYDADGTTELVEYTKEELDKKVARGDIVKVEDEYFRKATNADGEVLKGEVTQIVEDEGLNNVKLVMGNNEQEKFSISKNGQLVMATTNDVTTITIDTRKIAGPGPIFNSADEARAAAAREVKSDETNLRVDVAMEGTTVAEFDFLPVYTTSVELTGLSKKIGKGVEDYDPAESDEENLRKQLAKPIIQYLDEKGYYVLDLVCENITADVKENVGWINTMKTYQMTGGMVVVTYIKKHSAVVSLKQGFLGRGGGADENSVLAQLPAGSELLNPQDIDWKSAKPTVTYVTRNHATGIGSAKTTNEADEAAAQSAINEGHKLTVKTLNGGISSGIREAIDAKGVASTVANVRARMDTAAVSKEDMELTRREPKYTYTASCDRMVSTSENKLVTVTSWNGSKLVYIPPTDPIVDKGIPTDENYHKYIEEGDDLGILLFEKSDRGLRRYMDEVQNAQVQAGRSVALFEKTRLRLKEAQEIFDRVYDEKIARMDEDEETEVIGGAVTNPVAEEAMEAQSAETTAEEAVEEEIAAAETAVQESDTEGIAAAGTVTQDVAQESILKETVTEEASMEADAEAISEEENAEEASKEVPAEPVMTAQEALLAIFGESESTEDPVEEEVTEEVAEAETKVAVEEQSQEEVDAAFAKLLAGEQ